MENMINNDRMKNSVDFTELLTVDLNRVLKEYFEYGEDPIVEVYKSGNSYHLKLTLSARAVKAFSSVPPETAP